MVHEVEESLDDPGGSGDGDRVTLVLARPELGTKDGTTEFEKEIMNGYMAKPKNEGAA